MAAERIIDTLVTIFRFDYDKSAIPRLQRGLEQARRTAASAGRTIGGAFGAAGRELRANSAAIVGGLGGIGIALAGVATAAGRVGISLEDQFTQMNSMLGMPLDEIAAVRSELETMADETARPLQELAGAYYNLRSAGLDAAEAMQATNASAMGSMIGLGNTAEIADSLSSVMQTIARDGEDAYRIVELLQMTVREGKMQGYQLPTALSQAIPMANVLGVGLEEIGTAMAAMSRSGISPSRGATALNYAMLNLLDPNEQAKKILGDIGLEPEDPAKMIGEMGLIQTMNMLVDAVGDVQKLTELFSSEQAKVFLYDIMEGRDQYRDIADSLAGSWGVLDESAATAAAMPGHQARRTRVAAEDTLAGLYEAFDGLLVLFGKLPAAIQGILAVLGGGAGLLAMFGQLGSTVRALGAVLGAFMKGLGFGKPPRGPSPWDPPTPDEPRKTGGLRNILGTRSGRAALGMFALGGAAAGVDYIAGRESGDGQTWGGRFMGFLRDLPDRIRAFGNRNDPTFGLQADLSPIASGMAALPPTMMSPPSITIENIEVNTQATDAEGIARGIGGAMRDALSNMAEDFDSGVAE